jgi:hypothetical protein
VSFVHSTGRSRTTTRRNPRLSTIVLALVVVLDCLPHPQAEDDHDHEDEGTRRSPRRSTIVLALVVVLDCLLHPFVPDSPHLSPLGLFLARKPRRYR